MTRPSADPVGHPTAAAEPPARAERSAIVPPAPAGLTTWGLGLWTRLWEVGAGVYSPRAHLDTVTRYVQLQERRAYFLRVIEDEGWTTVGSQGQVVLHPLARQLDSIETKLVPLEDRLGLSPEASIRLGIATVEAKSKLDAFLEGAGRQTSPAPPGSATT